jgi:hypothetical protein
MGNKDGKRPQDLIDLYIDHYIDETDEQLTQQEVDDLQAEMAAINKANGF